MTDLRYIRARTGKKVHLAMIGSSTTYCGWWTRGGEVSVQFRRTSDAAHLCERCMAPSVVAVALAICGFIEWANGGAASSALTVRDRLARSSL